MGYSYRRYGDSATTAVWVLIAANVVVYLAASAATRNFIFLTPGILDQFAVSRTGLGAHPWTIVTSMFLHDGIYHILGNMLMLYIYGIYLAQVISEIRLLLVYFIGGLVGNGLFLAIAPSYAQAVGASGAVFALGGALAVMRPRIKVAIFGIVPMDLWVYVLISGFLLGILPALGQSNIGWQAHLGGLAVGLGAGWYFRRWERRRGIYR